MKTPALAGVLISIISKVALRLHIGFVFRRELAGEIVKGGSVWEVAVNKRIRVRSSMCSARELKSSQELFLTDYQSCHFKFADYLAATKLFSIPAKDFYSFASGSEIRLPGAEFLIGPFGVALDGNA
jgi:hypothetical protein